MMSTPEEAPHRAGIVFNGATGELAAGSILPALMAMRDEGGLPLADGSRLVPDVLLVGAGPGKARRRRGADRLRPHEHGLARRTR